MADPGQLLELLRSFPFLADQPPEVLVRLVTQGQLLRLLCTRRDPEAKV